jgi:hypothetical protein
MSETITAVQRARILNPLREKLQDLYRITRSKKQAEADYKDAAGVAIPDLAELVGVNGGTVRFTDSDGVTQAAKLVQADAGEYWDQALLIEWLKQNSKWNSVKTTVLDPERLKSEINSGNIDFDQVRQFLHKKDPNSPYVKFVNATADSL